MAPPRTRLTEAEWNQHQSCIKRMIIDQNMSQEEARQRLKDEGFLVTKAQFEYKLKIWGFRKKAAKKTSDAIWQFIGHHVEKRKQLQKASDVLLNGQLVDPAKVRKEINRHQPNSLVRFSQGRMSPKTPESSDVVIRTPLSTSTQSLWPRCLPWLLFQQNINLSLNGLQPAEVIGHAPIEIMAQRETTFLYSLSHVTGDFAVDNVSCLTTGLNILMPETYIHENRERAQLLLRGSPEEVLTERVKLMFYEISNKLGNLDINYDPDSILHQWLPITALLEKSGIIKMPFQLGTITDATFLSVTESLFQQAFFYLWHEYRYNLWHEEFIKEQAADLDSKDYQRLYRTWNGHWDSDWQEDRLVKLSSWRIINWLLSCGQNPNIPIPREEESHDCTPLQHARYRTPLQHAAFLLCPQLIFLLLDANSDPNLVFDEPEPFIEGILESPDISCTDKVRILKYLLEDSACANFFEGKQRAVLLAAAVRGLRDRPEVSESELLDMLIDKEAESCTKYRTDASYSDRWATQTCSVLGHAAGHSSQSAAMRCVSHLLDRISRSVLSVLPAQFITPDVVLLAASRGHNEVLDLLQELDVDFTLCGDSGTTALHVAAYYGHLETCQRLLELGVPVDGCPDFQQLPSPLHLAAFNDKLEIIKLLHEYGAQLTKSITKYDSRHWGIHYAHSENEAAKSPFGAAIVGGNRQMCEYFAQQGVPCPPSAAYYEACRPCPRSHLLQLALDLGADPNWTEENGFSALQVVLQWREYMSVTMKVETAMGLIDAGAVLNGGEITKAIELGDWNLIDRLLEMHLQGNGQSYESISVLEVAIASGSPHLITQTLIHYPGTYDAAALCSSVLFEEDGLRIIGCLLDKRPQLQHVLPLESLAIGIAAWRDRADLLDLLLAKFSKPSTATLPGSMVRYSQCPPTMIETARASRRLFWREQGQVGISPLSLALKSEKSLSRLLDHGFLPDRLTMSIAAGIGHNSPIRKLLGYPMLSHGLDFEGPLASAVGSRAIDAVKCLLDGNHCVNEDNSRVERGRNPLQMAVEYGSLDLIKLLLEAGADVNAPAAKCRGATALQLAAMKGYLGVAKMLVDLGADVNASGATDEGGRTALEGAAEHGRIDTIQYLLIQGVKTNAKGRLSYLRAIRYAELEGHMVAAKLIKKWREWTVKDDALWEKLKSLPKDECEWFTDEDFEDQSDSESGLERHSPGKVNEGDEMQDLVFDGAPAVEAHTHEVSVTANLTGGIISELEDLEMMTSDAFAFWPGL